MLRLLAFTVTAAAFLGIAQAQMPGVQRSLPPYVRGKGKYQWMLQELERDRGITYYGSAERLRAKMEDLVQGMQAHQCFRCKFATSYETQHRSL